MMKLLEKLKDFFSSFKEKTIVFLFLTFILTINFSFIKEKQGSAIEIIKSIDLINLYWSITLPLFAGICFLFIIHEVFKLLSIEIKGDIAISMIVSITLSVILMVRNFLVILTESQFNLIVTLFGLPGIVFLPKLFNYLLHFRNHQTVDAQRNDDSHDLENQHD